MAGYAIFQEFKNGSFTGTAGTYCLQFSVMYLVDGDTDGPTYADITITTTFSSLGTFANQIVSAIIDDATGRSIDVDNAGHVILPTWQRLPLL